MTYLAPAVTLPSTRRAWPFVMPAALLALVAGFRGSLTWTHAGVLALLGLVVANLWQGADAVTAGAAEPGTRAVLPAGPAEPDDAPDGRAYRWVYFALAVALSAVGAWAMARGAARLELTSRTFTGPLVAAAVLSPLLTLPVLGTTTRLAERGEAGSAVATLVAIALVNLCLILPLVIVTHYVVSGTFQSVPTTATAATTAPSAGAFTYAPGISITSGQATPYPLMSWRIDTVLLVVLGFGLIPWSLGRWAVSRMESAALIFGYALYLALTALLSHEWR